MGILKFQCKMGKKQNKHIFLIHKDIYFTTLP